MNKQIEMYGGDLVATCEETDQKKQMLWDAFLKWCQEHNASTGESAQNDDFLLDSPAFMADAIDNIISFRTEWKDGSDF